MSFRERSFRHWRAITNELAEEKVFTCEKAEKHAENIITSAKNQAGLILQAAEARADSLIKGK